MNYRLLTVSIIIIFACFARGGIGAEMQNDRVLVLGFQSRQLNDVQDRLLRETLLYRIHANGHEIVPVMKIESLFRDDSKRFIRRLSRADVRALCDELNAGVAVYGSIAPADGKQDDGEIRKGKNYTCLLSIYRKGDNSFTDTKHTVAGRDSLYDFFADCAAQFAEEILRVTAAP